MSLYSTLVFLHVITAILGFGPIAIFTFGGKGPITRDLTVAQIGHLMRWAGQSLGGMFLTGAGIVALTHGAMGRAWWLRIAFALFVVLGALQGVARSRLRKANANAAPAVVLQSIRPLCWGMCFLLVAITYLMEAKPW